MELEGGEARVAGGHWAAHRECGGAVEVEPVSTGRNRRPGQEARERCIVVRGEATERRAGAVDYRRSSAPSGGTVLRPSGERHLKQWSASDSAASSSDGW